MTTSQGQFKLNMDGLLEVLAGSLYANPVVGLRELIQNAHDSCTRFAVEGDSNNFQPMIKIQTDGKTLTITDNGSGLTFAEIETYLTTIGRSYTRELRSNLHLFADDISQELIGQFGFGFLSAFMIADEVIVETKSWQEGSESIRLTAGGGDSFTIEQGIGDLERGTTITLQVRADATFLLEPHILRQKIRQFANFLPIPIYLNENEQPANEMTPPWEQPNASEAIQQFIRREFQLTPSLVTIELNDYIKPIGDGDNIEIPLRGFLFIPDATVASVREFGDLHVYIRGMYITDTERDLLPPWAKFVRGIVESPYLHPTASRESVRRDENFSVIQESLGQQLTAALQRIQQDDAPLWARIVRGHADVMTGWAVRDDDFFAQVAHILTFRTSQGRMTLPEYLNLTDGKLYYVTHEIKSLQEKVLAEGNSYPVIEAVWFAVRPFLEKFAAENGRLELIPLDEEPTKLFQQANTAQFTDLLAAAERLGISVQMASFEPAAIPALIIHPKDAQKWMDTRQALDNNELDPAIADFIASYAESQAAQELEKETLFINAQNAFIQHLAKPAFSEKQHQLVLDLLYQVARLFSGKTMTATTAIEAFDTLTNNVRELIE